MKSLETPGNGPKLFGGRRLKERCQRSKPAQALFQIMNITGANRPAKEKKQVGGQQAERKSQTGGRGWIGRLRGKHASASHLAHGCDFPLILWVALEQH